MNWYKRSQHTMDIPTTLYHATFRANLPSIMKDGLIPGGKIKCYEPCTNGVYLHIDPDGAIVYPSESGNPDIPEEWFEDIVVLVINASQLDILSFDEDPELPSGIFRSFIYNKVIPPSAIKDVI